MQSGDRLCWIKVLKLSGRQKKKGKIRKWIKQESSWWRTISCIEGFRTVQAYHLSTAKKLLQQASDGDIVVSDLRLPDGDGIDLLRWMRKEGMTQPLIIMTNYAEVHTAVESMKLGSLDYRTEYRTKSYARFCP